MRPNKVKRLLREGKPAIGTWIGAQSPLLAELLAHAGFDWLVVDCEHGETDVAHVQAMLQAISTTDTVPMVRIPWNDPVYFKRVLDAGAYGVVVPMVLSRADAERAVQASKYPPMGSRGIGGTRGRLYGGPDYLEKANEEIVLLVQIEHAEAVRNAEAILSVDGVDGCFIGPNDLSASLGLLPGLGPADPRFQEAVATVLAAARRCGKAAGIHTFDVASLLQRQREGFQFLALGSDLRFLSQAVGEALTAVRRALA